MQEMRVLSLGLEDLLEKERATHSSILARKFPWTEEPGSLRSIESQRVGHDLVTEQRRMIHHNQARLIPKMKDWSNIFKSATQCKISYYNQKRKIQRVMSIDSEKVLMKKNC